MACLENTLTLSLSIRLIAGRISRGTFKCGLETALTPAVVNGWFVLPVIIADDWRLYSRIRYGKNRPSI